MLDLLGRHGGFLQAVIMLFVLPFIIIMAAIVIIVRLPVGRARQLAARLRLTKERPIEPWAANKAATTPDGMRIPSASNAETKYEKGFNVAIALYEIQLTAAGLAAPAQPSNNNDMIIENECNPDSFLSPTHLQEHRLTQSSSPLAALHANLSSVEFEAAYRARMVNQAGHEGDTSELAEVAAAIARQ